MAWAPDGTGFKPNPSGSYPYGTPYGTAGVNLVNPAGYLSSVAPDMQPRGPDGLFPLSDNPYVPFFGAPLKPEPPRREPRSHYDQFEAYDGTHSIHLSQYSIRKISETDTFWLKARSLAVCVGVCESVSVRECEYACVSVCVGVCERVCERVWKWE